VARHGEGKRAPRGRIGRAHGILVIPCSHTGVWADMRRKTPTGFWAKRQVFDVLPPKARRSEKGFAGDEVWRRLARTGLSVQEET
jgi:hypothetical protein